VTLILQIAAGVFIGGLGLHTMNAPMERDHDDLGGYLTELLLTVIMTIVVVSIASAAVFGLWTLARHFAWVE